jgi:hypothetical protein
MSSRSAVRGYWIIWHELLLIIVAGDSIALASRVKI